MQWSEANSENQGLDTFYFERYENYGSSTSIDNKVSWSGHHVMDIYNACKDIYNACNFTMSELIIGDEYWLDLYLKFDLI